jgi:hypothetical protein
VQRNSNSSSQVCDSLAVGEKVAKDMKSMRKKSMNKSMFG